MGRVYWGRKEEGRDVKGIVVIFAWLSSQEKHIKPYLRLYASLGWNCLICHSDFLYLFFPGKAAALAVDLLNELSQELTIRSLPIVFAAFSGGSKGCMYKALQIIQGHCEAQISLEKCQLIRDCISGHIYDSSPVDFTSDIGTKFVLHPSVLKMPEPPRLLAWLAKGVASGLDSLFLSRFEEQRAEYWRTLYSSVNMGPFLILCSQNDDLAPYPVVLSFAQRLQRLGGDVNLVHWTNSMHVVHYKLHHYEYRAAVSKLLEKAFLVYTERVHRLSQERMDRRGGCSKISESVCHLRKAAMCSNQSLRRVALGPRDHFFLPSSLEYLDSRDTGSMQDEQRMIHLLKHPSMNAHSVLGKLLFDACNPKKIEDWDIDQADSLDGQLASSSWGHMHFNPVNCARRSKL